MSDFSAFLQLQKIDVARREVWGVAALEEPDRAREIMDYEKSLPNFLNWSRDMNKASGGQSLGNVRAMHGDVAAGKVIHLEPRDGPKTIYVGTKIVDDNEWNKVLEGVYTGFSVGGSYGEKWPDPNLPGYTRYEAKPVEISLVDVPCMPGAQFEIVKADGSREMKKFAKVGELGKGDFEGHPFRGNQYADVAGGHDNMESAVEHAKKTSNGNTLTIFKHSATGKYHVMSNEQSAKIDPFSDEYTYVSQVSPRKLPKPDRPQNQDEVPDRFVTFTNLKQSVGVADLIKGTGMKTKDVLEKLNASSDPAMKELADQLSKAFPPAKDKKEDPKKEDPKADDSKDKSNPLDESGNDEPDGDEPTVDAENDTEEEAGAEADEQPEAGQPTSNQTEAIRSVVIQLLAELGFVQEQGGQSGAPTAVKFLTAESLQKGMSTRDEDLAKISNRQTEITSDLAKLANTIEEMVKRGGPAPVIRDLGVFTAESAGMLQKSALLKEMLEKTTDPLLRQSLQAEITTIEIKKSQQSPIR